MLMVIFGAGASYDSAPSYLPKTHYAKGSPVENSRPPLAAELFENRPEFARAITRFSACQPVIPYLRDPPKGISVEQVLEQLQVQAEKYPRGLQQLTAIRYYLHFTIWECEYRWREIYKGVTNYQSLLDRIERHRKSSEPVCLVTFNYDRMLEAALSTVGLHIKSLAEYVNSKDYKLIKLHGSVNWGREIDESPMKKTLLELSDGQIPGEVIRISPELLAGKFISRDYRIAFGYAMGKSGGAVLFPALAIPVETKLDFECPEDHLSALRNCIPKTNKVLVIGWRATDAPFLELLSKDLPPDISVMVVAESKDKAQEVAENMQRAGIKGKEFFTSKHGFTHFILNYEVDGFLRS